VEKIEFMRSPLGIASLMLVSSVSGSMIKDRLGLETTSSASSIRIDELDKRLVSHLAEAMTRQMYEQGQIATTKRMDDLREDLHDIKLQLSALEAGPPAR
jgi:hypothetical protein